MTTTKDSAPPTTRTARGLALYRERGGEIEHPYPGVYRVPSCTGKTFYTVHLSPRERCECPDHERHPELTCKHLAAATIAAAKSKARRRSA